MASGMEKLGGAVMGAAGAGTLATALAQTRKKDKNDPRYGLEEADRTRAGMLRTQLKEAQSPIDEARVGQQAEDAYQAAMGPAQQANIEALRAGLAGGTQPGQQLEMFGQLAEKGMEEKAKATSEAYKQAGEQKLKQADQAYAAIGDETERLRKERTDLLWDKIPRVGFLMTFLVGSEDFSEAPAAQRLERRWERAQQT